MRQTKLSYLQGQTQQTLDEIVKHAIDLYYQRFHGQDSNPLARLKQSAFIGSFKAEENLAANSKATLHSLFQQQHDH
ncbi:MAG: hypothetical protein HC866_11405 [Leptolyngbyaceae cyanobacterium RU_5_1]|nr:hypothetical protein [Leptolyngbyaceae cyanobacterium RU_5_1]